VLLVTIDTLRADHVGAYGAAFAATPTLDALASEGVRFETAIAASPLTLPSHASILTGLLPPRHGVRHNGVYRLPADVESIAQRFQQAGYSTAAVVGSIVLASRYGLDRGFDVYDEQMGERRASATGYPERGADEVTTRALAFLDSTPRPFFLWIHYYDAHAAYQPPEPFASRFRDRPYDGEIAAVDAALGRVVERLRVQGRLDRTVVAATSDHGESLGEHGERTHGYGLYDATLAVPLVMRGPGVPPGRLVRGVVSSVSIAPTLLAAAGLPPLATSDGIDLASYIAGAESPADAAAYAETLAPRIDHGFAPLFAWRTNSAHYVRAPRAELYDVARDPAQTTNLLEQSAGSTRARALASERALDPASERALDPASERALDPASERAIALASERAIDLVLAHDRATGQVELDAGTRAQLESLGYALPATPRAQNGIDPKDGLPLLDAFEAAKAAFYRGDVARAKALAEPLAGAPSSGPAGSLSSTTTTEPGASSAAETPAASDGPQVSPAPLATSPELHELLTRIAFSEARPDRARMHAEIAARLAPENPRVQLMLGDAAFELGDAEAALAAWGRADALDGMLAAAKAGLVLGAARRGAIAEAEALAAAARALEPASAALEERLAAAWDRAGDAERALTCARESLRLDRERPSVHMLAAIQLARLGAAREAAAEHVAAGDAGLLPAAVNRLAIAFAGAGDTARAESLLRALVAAHPEHSAARRNLVLLVRRLGRVAEADAIESAAPRGG
jgi:arylsulfatase A-like enzyme/Flp pilus assembly protein TadD